MAEEKTTKLEREYIVPLRKAWLKAPKHDRTRIAVREIKRFVARHMRIPFHDIKQVKIDVSFNNEVWFRGRRSPPGKVKVKAVKDEDVVRVGFAEVPEYVKFHQIQIDKRHKKLDVKEEPKKEEKKELSEEKKKEEKEKESSVAEANIKEAESKAKAQKHALKGQTTKTKGESFHRMALQK